MSFFDLVKLIFDNLGRRKARVALTAIGVVIGTAAVVILVSLAIGLQRNATEQLYGIGDLTQIEVYPSFGGEGGGGGGGGGPAVSVSPGQPTPQNLITDKSLTEFAAIPGVQSVIPRDSFQGSAMLNFNRLETWPNLNGVGIGDLSELSLQAAQGTTALQRGGVIVGALVASNFYDPKLRPGQEPPSPPDLMDQQLKLTLMKWDADGQEIRKSYQLRVIGVLAETRGPADWSMYVPIEDTVTYNQWFMGRRINRSRDGYQTVIVKAASVDQVLDVNQAIVDLGYQAYTPQSYVQGINSFFTVLQVVFGGVGAIALLVAAIGIANTMAMAILERTREIGLMKAIGATNRDVLSVFLGEAAGIGFLGGLGGVLTGWLAGQVINVIAVGYLAEQAAQQGTPPPSMAVYTPLWLPFFALAFATIIGLLSGMYPALRAATLIPVQALKYE